jgi:hypothetical protein
MEANNMSYENKGVKVGIRDIGEIINLVERLSGKLNAFNAIGKSVTLNVSQGSFDIELGLEVRPGRPLNRVMKIPIFDAQRINLTSLPSLHVIDDAIILDENDGIVLSLDNMPEGVDSILLNIRCPLKHRRFMSRLVNKQVQMEPRNDVTSYWMTAQFKHLAPLRHKLDSLRVEDLDFFVQVNIEQNIKEIIPHSFIRELEVGKELLQTKDREEKLRLAQEHLRLAQSNKLVGKEEKVVEKIEELLKPSNFQSYLELLGQFYYHDCFQTGTFFRIPNFVIPSMMRVVSKTNLTLDEPAKKGELKFKRQEFEDKFEEIFPEKKKKRKRTK